MADKSAPNAEQIEFWNGEMGARWVALQDRLDTMLAPLGTAAMDRAAVKSGEAVLDVGCGCGATTLALAERVGTAGKLFGVDISTPMLTRARERAAALPGAKPELLFQVADAQTASLGAPRFDLLYSRFGVMFFADPAAAFANLRGALKPGGRVAFACWRALDENPWMKLPLKIGFEHVPPPPRPGPEDPGPFSFADRDRVRRILTQAGFAEIEFEPVDIPLLLGATADLDEAVDFVMKAGPLAGALAEADGPTREKVRGALREGLAAHHKPEGIRMNGAIWVVRARNAA